MPIKITNEKEHSALRPYTHSINVWQQWDSNPGPPACMCGALKKWPCLLDCSIAYFNVANPVAYMAQWSMHRPENTGVVSSSLTRTHRYDTILKISKDMAQYTGLGCFTQPWLPGLVCSPGLLEKVCLSQQRSARSAIIKGLDLLMLALFPQSTPREVSIGLSLMIASQSRRGIIDRGANMILIWQG